MSSPPDQIYTRAESSLAAIRRTLADVRNFQLARLREFRGSLDKHREMGEEMRADLEGAHQSIQVRLHSVFHIMGAIRINDLSTSWAEG